MSSPSSGSSTSSVSQTTSLSINALISGFKWGGASGTGASLSYSFPWSSSTSATFSGAYGNDYSRLNEPAASTHYGLNTIQQAAAAGALQSWANVANIGFSAVSDTPTNVGDIRFAWTSTANLTSTGEQAWGWASYPNSNWPSGGDVWLSTSTTSSNWSVGSYNYYSLIHETGHALGLKHPFEGSVVLPLAEDSRLYSVMSYTNAPHSLYFHVTHNANGSISGTFTQVEPDTPMLYDVTAMQYMYGANSTYHAGNDTYTFDPATPFIRTLWDAGGTDTLSVANFTKGCTIDLRPGHFSKITIESDSTSGFSASTPTPTYDGTDNLCIALGSVIENALGGSGNDTLIGNDANNTLNGNGGADTLIGGPGCDVYIVADARVSIVETAQDNIPGATASRDPAVFDSAIAQRLEKFYLAFYGRAADYAGLTYWQATLANQLQNDQGLMCSSFGNAQQPEYVALYGANVTDAAFVANVYQNLFGRTPDTAGRDYWVSVIQSLESSGKQVDVARAQAVILIVDGSQGADAALINAKVAADTALSKVLAQYDDSNIYGGTASIAAAHAWAQQQQAGITPPTVLAAYLAPTILGHAIGDEIDTSVSFTLPANVENLVLTGAQRISCSGNAADNILTANAGLCTLTGGGGSDAFVFAALPGAGIVDQITDFLHGTDAIVLLRSAFSALSAGPAAVVRATAATQAGATMLYDPTTATLSYDPDGSGSQAAIMLATLVGNPTVTTGDVWVV